MSPIRSLASDNEGPESLQNRLNDEAFLFSDGLKNQKQDTTKQRLIKPIEGTGSSFIVN